MSSKIAVQQGLKPITEHLRSSGYEVTTLENSSIDNVDAVVLSGMDDNMYGDQSIRTKNVVINAEGRTPEEIEKELSQRLQFQK